MADEDRSMTSLASMSDDFRKVARVACRVDDTKCIVKQHMRNMKTDLRLYFKREEKKVKDAEAMAKTMPTTSSANTQADQNFAMPTHSGANPNLQRTSDTTEDLPTSSNQGPNREKKLKIGNPPKSTTKGRPAEIANHNPLDLGTKKATKCSHCGSTQHTMTKCVARLQSMGLLPPGKSV